MVQFLISQIQYHKAGYFQGRLKICRGQIRISKLLNFEECILFQSPGKQNDHNLDGFSPVHRWQLLLLPVSLFWQVNNIRLLLLVGILFSKTGKKGLFEISKNKKNLQKLSAI